MFQDANAARIHSEKWYQQQWCPLHDGLMEQVLANGTRVDCITKEYAMEFDFGDLYFKLLIKTWLIKNYKKN